MNRDARTTRLVGGLIRSQPWRYAANAVLWTSIWTLPVLPGLITRAFFNRLESGVGFNVTTLIAFIAAYGLGRLVIMVTAMHNDVHFMFRLGALMRRNMFARILARPGAQSGEEASGEVITRFREDVEHVEETTSWTVDMFGALLFATIAVWVLMGISVDMTVLVFLPLVVVIFLAERAGTWIRRYREAARAATGRVTEAIGEVFGAVQSIKVAGAEQPVLDHLRQLNEERKRLEVRDTVLNSGLESLFWNTVNIGTGLVLLAAAGRLGAGTGFTVGDFALFVYFMSSAAEVVHIVGLFIARLRQAGVSFERMAGLLGGAPASDVVARAELCLTGPLPALASPQRTSEHALEVLEVEGLTFHYPGTGNGIDLVDLRMERGSFTVITGRIGSGKTTLLRALLGLVEADKGLIRWNGAVVDDPGTFFVPPRSAYTPQVPRLFSMTLRENLLLGIDAGEDELMDAIKAAVLEPDLDTMPAGLETQVGPQGVRLSGGQVQRAAAARMLVRRPDLLVFDDLSSALDVDTEKHLWDRLLRTDPDVTSLVVSHRKAALQRADQVVVMSEGRIEARGTLEEVLAISPELQRLWSGGNGNGNGNGR